MCFLHAKHSLRKPPHALGSHKVIKSAIVQQCCRRFQCCDQSLSACIPHATCLLCIMTQGWNALSRDTAIGSSATAQSELERMHPHATCLFCTMTQGRNALSRDTAIGSSVTAQSELRHSHAAFRVGNERQASNAGWQVHCRDRSKEGRHTICFSRQGAEKGQAAQSAQQ